ncbi:MAG: malto-oligosyltrehalose trehalohydrolase [Angustibacter sp.]
MHRHAVWAPGAQRVELIVRPGDAETSTALHPSTGGWWRSDGAGAEHGTDYCYRVDGGPPLPDPRSPWQPAGVHGPSRVFDPDRFSWTDRDWTGPRHGRGALGAVLYELHIGTFTPEGTFAAAIKHLDHLVELGVDIIQLMPITAFAGKWGWGYDSVHAYAVHEPYGGPSGLQNFVNAAHGAGLGVSLDMVYNHLGPCGNYLGQFGPYFTDKYHTPWGPAINLDGPHSSAVRRWIIDNALRWFRDFHIDALRLDAVHELRDDSATHILAQLSEETSMLSQSLGRRLDLIAESDLNDPRTIEAASQDGLGMTAQWADDVHHAVHAALTGERQGYYVDFGSLEVLAQCLTRVFRHDGQWSTFRGRTWGRAVDPQRHRGHAFVVSLQTHDQVGNRALGERIDRLMTPGQQAIGAALICTSAFSPMLFMGEEWSATSPWQFFTDFDEPELAEAVRRGRRQEFAAHGWPPEAIPDPQDPRTRDRSVLRWDELRHAPHQRMFRWYQSLLALRRHHRELQEDSLANVSVEFSESDQWLVVARGDLRIAANLADSGQKIPLDGEPIDVVLCWDSTSTQLQDGSMHLGPHGVAIVRIEAGPVDEAPRGHSLG